MAYRQLVGFVLSIFALMKVALRVPHFTTLVMRAKLLGKHFKRLSKSTLRDLVFDSSGFKSIERESGRLGSMVNKREGDGRNFILAYALSTLDHCHRGDRAGGCRL